MRTIETIYDLDRHSLIPVDIMLNRSEESLYQLRGEATERHQADNPRYFCAECGHPVYVRLNKNQFAFFYHRKGASADCPWFTGDPNTLQNIDRNKFGGLQEGPLHHKLKSLIRELSSADSRFTWAVNEQRITDQDTGEWRRPDVYACFDNKKLAFELQLATTHNPVIIARETFYKSQGIFIIWVFSSFERFREHATAKDIYHRNNGNAFELDEEAIAASREAQTLILKAHWAEPYMDGDLIAYEWKSQLIDFNQLKWDSSSAKPYLSDLRQKRNDLLRKHHADFVKNIDELWANRHAPRDKQGMHQHNLGSRAFDKLNAVLEITPHLTWNDAQDCRFERVLDTLYAIRLGAPLHAAQNLAGLVNTALESWPKFTKPIVAMLDAHNRSEVLRRAATQEKIARNLSADHFLAEEYTAIIRFLFPEVLRIE